jgi:hypothetical protein
VPIWDHLGSPGLFSSPGCSRIVPAIRARRDIHRRIACPHYAEGKFQASLESGDGLAVRYDGHDLTTIASEDLENGRGQVEVLIDKGVVEIFVDGGVRYITREIPLSAGGHGLELSLKQKASAINHLEIYEMKSMWKPRTLESQ